jgi:hypothetical protein
METRRSTRQAARSRCANRLLTLRGLHGGKDRRMKCTGRADLLSGAVALLLRCEPSTFGRDRHEGRRRQIGINAWAKMYVLRERGGYRRHRAPSEERNTATRVLLKTFSMLPPAFSSLSNAGTSTLCFPFISSATLPGVFNEMMSALLGALNGASPCEYERKRRS